MGNFHNGYENIKVELIDFTGDALAEKVVNFNALAEFNEPDALGKYSSDNPEAIRIVNEIIDGKTFPKKAFEGHLLSFRIHNISRK